MLTTASIVIQAFEILTRVGAPVISFIKKQFSHLLVNCYFHRSVTPNGLHSDFLIVRIVNNKGEPIRIETVTLLFSNNFSIMQGDERWRRSSGRGTPVVQLTSGSQMGASSLPARLQTSDPVDVYFDWKDVVNQAKGGKEFVSGFLDQVVAVDSLTNEHRANGGRRINSRLGAEELFAAAQAKEALVRFRRLARIVAIATLIIASTLGIVWFALNQLSHRESNAVVPPSIVIASATLPPELSVTSEITLAPTAIQDESGGTVILEEPADRAETQPTSDTASVQMTENTALPTLGATRVAGPDSATLVYVPGGEFMMGSSGELGNPSEEEIPIHLVSVEGFWIDIHEVTNSMFGLCVAAGREAAEPGIGCDPHVAEGPFGEEPYFGTVKFANYPVVNVSWFAASDYCDWAGRRLPSEAEWEYAARGEKESLFPWDGNLAAQVHADFRFGASSDSYPSEVGLFPHGASPFGVLDMAGNVWEWTADWFEAYPGSPYENAAFGENRKTVRGGSFASFAWDLRTAARRGVTPHLWEKGLGFRCAVSELDN